MATRTFLCSVFVLLVVLGVSFPCSAGDTGALPAATLPRILAGPEISNRVHTVNKLHLMVTNWGIIGSMGGELKDPQTGLKVPGAEWPAGTQLDHLKYCALWVGAIVGSDSLVSTGYDSFVGLTEFYPDQDGWFRERSCRKESPYYSPDAISEQDFICFYTDTLTNSEYVPTDQYSWRPHRPLGVRVRQESFAWSYPYAEDFIIIRYWINNISSDNYSTVRIGFLADPQVHHWYNPLSATDDHIGFLEYGPSIIGYDVYDWLNIMWFADNDGDPIGKQRFDDASPLSAGGLAVIGSPIRLYDFSDWGEWWFRFDCFRMPDSITFNWWRPHRHYAYDWGPQLAPPKRSATGGLGTPLGDRHKYRRLANGEIDYGQIWTGIDFRNDGWIGPPHTLDTLARGLARGADAVGLLTVGPFTIDAGDSIPIVLAVAVGDAYHTNPNSLGLLPSKPDEFYQQVSLEDLGNNIQWAKWMYDNPGKDSDGDGCHGWGFGINCRDTVIPWNDWRINEEICDTVFIEGDGVPDFTGPPSPPAPVVHLASAPGTIHLTWDGSASETAMDYFSQGFDFEGYNVYLGSTHLQNELTLIASWDRENYDRYLLHPDQPGQPWTCREAPFTREQLLEIYGGNCAPEDYPSQYTPYMDAAGHKCYFEPHGNNAVNEYTGGNEVVVNRIQRVAVDSLWDALHDTWLTYGTYQCTIDGLLPSQLYHVAVTAFDYGYAQAGLGSLESSPLDNVQSTYPSYPPDSVITKNLQVSVYPNPYKIDAGYRLRGFEDPGLDGFPERVRRINFANLPPQATIKIFSLDGDLIRELHHPDSRFSDSPSHTAWDIISRNTQAVVSGIYLFSVESAWGNQVGKLVIIK